MHWNPIVVIWTAIKMGAIATTIVNDHRKIQSRKSSAKRDESLRRPLVGGGLRRDSSRLVPSM